MVRASAPGKVLVLGGYLVVEHPNVGISIGVTARFTTTVTATESLEGDDGAQKRVVVSVDSPQFNAHFEFVATFGGPNDGEEVHVAQTEGPTSPFLFYSVLYSVTYAHSAGYDAEIAGKRVRLVLQADNDFYSQRNYLEQQGKAVTVEALRELPPHHPLVGAVSKTGLGSSAAMTTSVTACLLRQFIGSKLDNIEVLHRVAQIAHSVAQGKIGSGFDVYTAVYGTSVYRRFPAQCAEAMMSSAEPPTSALPSALATCIDLSKVWVESEPFPGLPRGLKLVLGDVHQGGSSTPGMVAKIMNWRKSVANQPDNLWDKLGNNNVTYIRSLEALNTQAQVDPAAHDAAVSSLATKHILAATESGVADGDDGETAAEKLWRAAAKNGVVSRRHLRDVGRAAEVKVEPEELTTLLDATAALPGVFAVGCPGAGGYDAVFALVMGDETCARVERMWESFAGMNVCPLLVREDPNGVLIDA